MDVLFAQSLIMIVIYLAVLSVSIFAFVNSLLYSAESYEAAGKLTKPAWCTILGIGVLLHFLSLRGIGIPLPLVGFALVVASLVYLVDVRPALAGLHRR
jgi:hypothetical protein